MTWMLTVPQRLPAASPAPRPDASFGEVVGAAFTNEIIDGDVRAYGARVERDVLTEIVDRLGPDLPPLLANSFRYPGVREHAPIVGKARAELLAAAAAAAAKNPTAWAGLPITEDAVIAEGAKRRSAEARDAADTLSMGGGGIGQMAAEFLGAGGSMATDPIQGPLMLAGAGAGGLLRTVAVESALGGVGEIAGLPARARVADELGRPELTMGDMAGQVAQGAAFAGAFGAGAHVLQRGAAYLVGRGAQARATTPPNAAPGDHAAAIDDAETALRAGAPVPGPAPVTTSADIARAAGKIIGAESGGRANAANPNSSALGPGQYTEATWLDTVQRHRPDLASTKSRSELLAMRTDPKLAREMTEASVGDYAARLVREGLDPTEPNLYLAHFLGESGAVRALLADPDAPISAAMSAEQIAANHGVQYAGRPIQHWTVKDLRRWSETKMGHAVDPGASYTPATGRGYTGTGEVVTPAGSRVNVTYEVVDLDTLTLASGDRQPRDRSRAAPTATVAARAAALDPAQLMPGPLAGSGAPVVGADNIIDSGNGRVMSIIHAADAYPDRYDAYTGAIRAAGFEIPDGMKRPVLIARRTTDLSPDELRQFVRDANDDVVERLAPSEQARTDAGALDDATMGLFDPTAGGLGAPANRPFLMRVVAGLPASQRGSVVDAAGRLTPAGAMRIQGAMLARAFDAPDLIEAATEAAGAEIKSLLDALTDVAPAWAQMRAAAAAGTARADFDITRQLVDAVRLIRDARAQSMREGIPVRAALADALAQGDMFSGGVDPITARIVGIAYDGGRARSRDAVAKALRDYIDEAGRIGDGGAGLLDALAPVGALDVLDGIGTRLGREAPTRAPDGEPSPAPADGAGVPVIDVAAANDAPWRDGALSPAAQAGADEAEATLRGGAEAAPASAPADPGAQILDAGDFEVEPGVMASEVLADLADDAEFVDVVNLCGLGGAFNG